MKRQNQSYLIPKEGLMVRKPNGNQMKAEGEWVTNTPFWTRRLIDGDVSKGQPEKKPEKKTPSKTSKSET